MVRAKLAIVLLTISLTAPVVYADGGKHEQVQMSPVKQEKVQAESEKQVFNNISKLNSTKTSEEFPTFHPLIVHFPIVLIVVALPFFLLGMFRGRIVFRQIGMVLASFGLLGALLAGYVFHPHTVGLTPAAKIVLSNHDFFAGITIYFIAGAVAIGWLTCVQRFQRLNLQVAASTLLLLSVITVNIAGHYGAKLVHIYGIGPKGDFLSKEHIGIHIPLFGFRIK